MVKKERRSGRKIYLLVIRAWQRRFPPVVTSLSFSYVSASLSSSVFLFLPPHPTGIRSCPHYNGISCLRVTLTISPLVLHVSLRISLSLSLSVCSYSISCKEIFVSTKNVCSRNWNCINCDIVMINFGKFDMISKLRDIVEGLIFIFNQVRGMIKRGGVFYFEFVRLYKARTHFRNVRILFHDRTVLSQQANNISSSFSKCSLCQKVLRFTRTAHKGGFYFHKKIEETTSRTLSIFVHSVHSL